ncbi:4-oxalocrotonate decarboxylase [Streptomyces sp. B1866]|uniref:2-keto-4-pentenoate hydratase n=1 Tax=Streptomyces sp. B1866 TaxID=3075431 RepID=UPI00288CA49D|nr:4-oxalocrotonate decarboxylase [Streptomyces sp. B1866]MDT3396534.1 4-oxalocrotonate decarboxylase [Streptomyces sp. B1866]
MATDVVRAARLLLDAEDSATALTPLTAEWPDLRVEDAYRVQDAALRLRLARGERLVGVKLGLTSRAKQQRMGVSEPLLAWLTDRMVRSAGSAVPVGGLIHPRIEPEIAFEMAAPVDATADQARARQAIGRVRAGLEVIDSRFVDYRFTLPDVVADNGSSAVYALGDTSRPADGDLREEGCRIEVDGGTAGKGAGADVLGDPVHALLFAARLLARRGLRIEAGWTVLTGGVTDAAPFTAGSTATAVFSSLGSVSLTAAEGRS